MATPSTKRAAFILAGALAAGPTCAQIEARPAPGVAPAAEAFAASAAAPLLSPATANFSAASWTAFAAAPVQASAPAAPMRAESAAPARATFVARALEASDAAALPALSAAAMDGSRANDAPPAAADAAGPRKLEVLKLRPTQMAVGLREVDKKIAQLEGKKAEAYLRAHPVPVVLGPNGRAHLIDHHHLVRAAWEAGIAQVPVDIKADLSGLSEDAFWERMRREKWVYPYDQLGGGPHDPKDLPENVRGMADDPYRSVAGEVRERGGYMKDDAPFSEFLWAQFFREHLTIHPVYHDFESAMTEAMALAGSQAAKSLPGWIGARSR